MNKRTSNESNWINRLLWAIYILLLMVLLPHTAWMFARAESVEAGLLDIAWGLVTAWAAAIVFELVIAAMTHKLSNHISNTPRYTDGWKRFRARYVNAYGGGLLLAWIVSTYANLAHAVEFGQPIKIFAVWGLPVWSYSVAFGAILPTASLLFAWVLSSVIEQDGRGDIDPENQELKKATEIIKGLKGELEKSSTQLKEAEAKISLLQDPDYLPSVIRWPADVDQVVYFIQGDRPEFVKIGVTSNLKYRIMQMQISVVAPIRLVGYSQGLVETDVHRAFSSARVSGEWFHLTDDLRNYIQENAQPAIEQEDEAQPMRDPSVCNYCDMRLKDEKPQTRSAHLRYCKIYLRMKSQAAAVNGNGHIEDEAIAVIAKASPAYVSEIISGNGSVK